MKTKMHLLIRAFLLLPLMIFLANDKTLAQNEGVIKIRKVKKESLKEGISLGLRVGPSFGMYGDSRSLIHEYENGFTSLSSNDTETSLTSTTGIHREYIWDFPGYNYAAYVNIPLNKNFQFVSEVGYRSTQTDYNIKYYNLTYTNSDKVVYQFSTKFRFSQLEVPLLIRAQTKWKKVNPYVMIGVVPIFNIKSQRITKVDSMSAPQYFQDEMKEHNYPLETNVTTLNNKILNFALSGAAGCKIRLTDRFKLCTEIRFVRMLNNNIFLNFQNKEVKESRMDALSVSVGVEYVLGK
jgi:hypothetical protein